jgi:hypothetical protein
MIPRDAINYSIVERSVTSATTQRLCIDDGALHAQLWIVSSLDYDQGSPFDQRQLASDLTRELRSLYQ